MAINLVRNSKVYFTSNVDNVLGTFVDAVTSLTASSLYEVQVLDGYSFSQNTETQQITVNEAGASPVRGSRTFNTALAPVDWSITTYVRPVRSAGIVQPAERVLWNAMMGAAAISTATTAVSLARTVTSSATVTAAGNFSAYGVGDSVNFSGAVQSAEWNLPGRIVSIGGTASAVVELLRAPAATATLTSGTVQAISGSWGSGASGTGTYSYTSTMGSQKNQLQKFAMLFVVDNVVYCVDNCALNQASIDFGIDQIAQIAWTGQGTALKQLTAVSAIALTASATTASSSANYITNKLSTMTLQTRIGGVENTSGSNASTAYSVAITGGNLTISNNITYLTPTNLGAVNSPITYFTGNRSITGNVTAYLKTGGSGDAGSLLTNLLAASASDTEPKFKAVVHMGGTSSQTAVPRLDFEMNGAMLQIPTVEIQDVVSTTINFVAQPFNPDFVSGANNAFDLERSNELFVKYFSS